MEPRLRWYGGENDVACHSLTMLAQIIPWKQCKLWIIQLVMDDSRHRITMHSSFNRWSNGDELIPTVVIDDAQNVDELKITWTTVVSGLPANMWPSTVWQICMTAEQPRLQPSSKPSINVLSFHYLRLNNGSEWNNHYHSVIDYISQIIFCSKCYHLPLVSDTIIESNGPHHHQEDGLQTTLTVDSHSTSNWIHWITI